MRHGSHKAAQSYAWSAPLALFTSQNAGAHRAAAGHASHHEREARGARGLEGTQAVALAPEVAQRINELMPLSRRSRRVAQRQAARKNRMLVSASCAALVGSVASLMAFQQGHTPDALAEQGGAAVTTLADITTVPGASRMLGAEPATMSADAVQVSRSQDRTSLPQQAARPDSSAASSQTAEASAAQSHAQIAEQQVQTTEQTTNEGAWSLGDTNAVTDASKLTRAAANNPQVAAFMDNDAAQLPKGFNPNHATGDVGNAYEFSQCTWWVYLRRHQLGLPVGSHMGNGNMWANSARALGYWVDNAPRHVGDVMVFAAGQAGSDGFYGHVAIVEKINPDGSIETSECGAVLNGRTISRTFSVLQARSFQYIHY